MAIAEDTFKLKCKCGMKVLVPIAAIGKKAQCKRCGHQFIIPPQELSDESKAQGVRVQ
ncbi:MAG: hypothetical protein QGG25_07770 [Phycisphaerae bacterium]|jgi:uncharacterized paraquat-inducible protein A|nr:hypothetical protein [Phycisphaerae bacterium]